LPSTTGCQPSSNDVAPSFREGEGRHLLLRGERRGDELARRHRVQSVELVASDRELGEHAGGELRRAVRGAEGEQRATDGDGLVNNPFAAGIPISVVTFPPPPDCPKIVTLPGSPPNAATLSRTHSSDCTRSSIPTLPELAYRSSPNDERSRNPSTLRR
jgi:hypothetical protein